MIRTVEWSDEAIGRANEIAHDYFTIRQPLGDEFVAHLLDRLSALAEFPFAATAVLRNQFRRVLLDKFPFHIYFVIHPDRISIVHIAHAHGDPREWKKYLRGLSVDRPRSRSSNRKNKKVSS
jgi:hypothetical protein